MALLDRIPWGFLIILCVALGTAPWFEEPHLVEKSRMLYNGTLRRPIDWFDLFWHLWPFLLVALKAIRTVRRPTPEPT